MAPKRYLELAAGGGSEPKRPKYDVRGDSEPPAMLRRLSIPHTPIPTNKSLPGTPWTGTPYPSRPSDSPSNPFGRKRMQTMTHSLPPPTSFSKHLALRFQFIRPGVSPRLGGIYRIVQVPLNYTFVQLRCLIAFLFGAGCGNDKEDRHLFQIQKKVTLYALTYKPGQIKLGHTTVKLSTARDPCRYRPELDEDALFSDDEPQQHTEDAEASAEEADEGDGWTWQPEEEYTLDHVWSKGGDLGCAIVYHHNTTTAVHITVNTTNLPRRSGKSNTPYVFQARGRVRLLPRSQPILARPLFSIPIHKLPSPANPKNTKHPKADLDIFSPSSNDPDADGEEDSDEDEYGDCGDASSCGLFQENSDRPDEEDNDGEADEDEDAEEPEEEDVEEEREDLHATIPASKYNVSHAFARYLRLLYQHNSDWKFSPSDASDSEDEDDRIPSSTPGLIRYPSASSSPASSSPFASSPASLFSHDPFEASVLSSLSSAAPTPAPMHPPWQRLRLERVQKRMEKLKKERWVESEDEVEELAGEKTAKSRKVKDEENEEEVTEGSWMRHPFDDVEV